MRGVYNKHRSAIEALGRPLLERKARDLEAHKANRDWLRQRRAAIQHEIAALDSEVDAMRAALAAADVATVEWGDLRRLEPFSDIWGLDRGRPLDRHYIEQFLSAHRHDIRGHVLEVKDDGYTRQFGAGSVTARDVLDINRSNLNATIVADLSRAESVGSNIFDCIILTQTLHIIPDIRSALRHARRMLNEGGTLLCTVPVVSRISYEDGGRNADYWRFTEAGLRLLIAEHFAPEHFQIIGFGNVLAATAFLYGLSPQELRPDELDHYDPWFPLLFGVRAVKVSDREGS
jgi:hypothetical protein